MATGDENKLNKLDDLKSKLFSRNYKVKYGHHDDFTRPHTSDVPDSWASDKAVVNVMDKFFLKTSVFKKFFFASLIFFVLALGYASYTFFISGTTVSSENIEISVVGNSFTDGGEDLPLVISVVNKNNSSLELVDLVLEYPKSAGATGSEEIERLRESLGSIAAGETKEESMTVLLYGEQGSIRPVKISLEYRVEGSNAIFVKEKIYEVTINSSPVDLSLDAPTTISPNQEVTLNIKAAINSTKAVSDVLVKVDYPVGFQFTSATPQPAYGNNVWSLGDLAPGTERKIVVTGRMVDVFDGEEKTFHVSSGLRSAANKSSISTVFNALAHTIAINKPFVEARLYINGVYQKEYTSDSKEIIRGEVHWVNNLDTKINDLEITAKITGTGVNEKTIKPDQGFYNSSNNTITWDKSSDRDFGEINPGDEGIATFSMSPASLFAGVGGLLSEPSINIEVSISGKQELVGYSTKEVKNSETKVVRITSEVGLANKIVYYSGAFKNRGTIPPKAEKETTYTVVWSLSNASNNISKAGVRATLPSWVKFANQTSPSTEDLTFNASTKEVLWNIGTIKKGTGITGSSREVSFQIIFTPSLSQVNTVPTLINEAILTGHDDFANVDVKVSKGSLSTRLINDPAFPPLGERVVE